MTVIEWLENVKKLDYMVNNLLERKAELCALATKVTAGESDGMPHASGTSDKVGNLSVKLVMLEQDIDLAIDNYIDYKTLVCRELASLPAEQYRALYEHYIDGKTWRAVADSMDYSYVQIDRIKRAGIANLEKSIGDVIECYTITVL